MIEIIQQTEKNAEGKLPKNIRQIGNPEKDFRIYMEDYVYTYLHPTQFYTMGECQAGIPYGTEELLPRLLILVGEINHFSNRSCAFICGAIRVENGAFSEELPELNEDAWRHVQKELQQYFGKSEVVGWVLDIPGNELEITREMEEVHRENFTSPYQFFFLMDSREREEAFYVWKGGHLSRKEGYFIYYEKNPGMQEYMIRKREDICGSDRPSEEIEDRAARHYRAMMREKKEQSYERGTGILSYLSSLLMVLVLCTVSVLLLGNIRRMEHMEKTISVMSDAFGATEEEKENETNQVAVETVSGSIYPIDGTPQDGTKSGENASDAAEQAGGNDASQSQAGDAVSGQASAGGIQNEAESEGTASKEQSGGAPQYKAASGEGASEGQPQDGAGSRGEAAGTAQNGSAAAGQPSADAAQGGPASAGAPQNEPAAAEQPSAGVPQNGSASAGQPSGSTPQSGASKTQDMTAEQSGGSPQNASGEEGGQAASAQAQDGQTEAERYLSQGYYIVQQGDSLRGICYKIYRNYKMIRALCEANAIEDQDYIWVGQKIVLP